MPFTFVGYFPKQCTSPGWVVPDHVRRICSVSECMCAGPENWITHWLHNDLGFYDTPELANQVIPSGSSEFTMLAFDLFDQRFTKTGMEPLNVSDVHAQECPTELTPLGYDVVSKSISASFECSPLSCSGFAFEGWEVNVDCLIDELEIALKLARQCGGRNEPEPGPYYLLRVSQYDPSGATVG